MATTGQRYKDVLLALATAHKYNQTLGRLQLQKFVYLADILSLIWDVVGPKEGHYTYKNGPYDPGIQNAADVLAFRGAVEIARSKIAISKVTAEYKITPLGINLVEKMIAEASFRKRADLYAAIGDEVERRGWKNLRQLVYAEATYVIKKGDNFGQSINVNSLLSNDSLRIVLDFNDLIADKTQELNKANLVSIFFKVVDNYRLIIEQQRPQRDSDALD